MPHNSQLKAPQSQRLFAVTFFFYDRSVGTSATVWHFGYGVKRRRVDIFGSRTRKSSGASGRTERFWFRHWFLICDLWFVNRHLSSNLIVRSEFCFPTAIAARTSFPSCLFSNDKWQMTIHKWQILGRAIVYSEQKTLKVQCPTTPN